MKILIAEDDPIARRVLQATLASRGYEVVVTCDGREAWEELQRPGAPPLAILDLMMPDVDGIDLCRRLRAASDIAPTYVIMLTTCNRKENVIEALAAGANDYVTKPFDPDELCARTEVGLEFISMQRKLAERVRELEEAMGRVKQLQGLLPICGHCKKIRNGKNYWQQVEQYITEHSEAVFSHGVCPECYETHTRPELEEFKRSVRARQEKPESGPDASAAT